MEFSNLSKEITKSISKVEKKKNGIYFTPPSSIHKSLEIIKPYLHNIFTVLEPSCGSCEYIKAIHDIDNTLQIIGIEYCDEIYNKIKQISKGNIKIINQDFLSCDTTMKFDLIPFEVFWKKNSGSVFFYKLQFFAKFSLAL